MTKLLGVAEIWIREMPRSMAGASAILNKGFRGFSQSIQENSGGGKPHLDRNCPLASPEKFVI
jgi:hypothetical protein